MALSRKVLIGSLALLAAGSTVVAWLLLHGKPVVMPKATCGGVGTQHGSSGASFHEWDPGALACFREAATSCRDASLLVTDSGVDTGTDDVIALHRGHAACTARVTDQSFWLDKKGPISRFVCDQVHVDDSGETVACGNGAKFSIPLHTG